MTAHRITDEQRQRVLDLHAAGQARNAIAAEVGIGKASVSRIVAAAGLSFDRSATVAATAAKVADVRARRADTALGLLDDVAHARRILHQQDEPQQAMFAAKAISSLVFAHTRLGELDEPADAQSGEVLDKLFDGLAGAYDELQARKADELAERREQRTRPDGDVA